MNYLKQIYPKKIMRRPPPKNFFQQYILRFETGAAFVMVAGFVVLSLLAVSHPLQIPMRSVGLSVDHYFSNKSPKNSVASVVPGSRILDVDYCSGQKMDIYQPRKVVYAASPMVMYVHGGGFYLNNKATEPDQIAHIEELRDEGFAVVSIDYHLVQEAYFPAALEDTLCAVRFLRAHAQEYRLDQARFGIYGFSAGGYLAAMAGTLDENNPYRGTQYAQYSSRVKAVATLAGLFDFTQGLNPGNSDRLHRMLNGVNPADVQAVNFVTPDDPPFLLLHGLKDQYVKVEQDDLFGAKLTANNVPYEIVHVANADHGLNPVGGELTPPKVEVRAKMHEFFKANLLK